MICKNCKDKMEQIIQEIQDTGYAYYCYTCGSVLVTEMKSEWFDNQIVGSYEEELEWFEVRK
jgi:hypothetical protein